MSDFIRDYIDGANGGWIRTFTGGRFYPLNPRIEDVDIRDIAHSLATKCRYGGQCSGFYSVAQHSVYVSQHCDNALKGLLHDSDEAYSPFGDIPRPVKVQIGKDYPPLAETITLMGVRIRDAVYAKYGLTAGEPVDVKAADNAILWDERRAFMNGDLTLMPNEERGLGIEIEQWPWEVAEAMFLMRFEQLMEKK